jgi:hypothetical protein
LVHHVGLRGALRFDDSCSLHAARPFAGRGIRGPCRLISEQKYKALALAR